jgi:hypothetical protein
MVRRLIHSVQDAPEPHTLGGYMERHARRIALLLFSVGWIGCADPQPEPTPADGVIPAGPTVQDHGIAGYQIGRFSGAATITLVDATGARRGELLVEGSAVTDDASAVSGAGARLRLRLDGVESTKRVRLAKGLYIVDDGPTGYVDSISISTDDAFGAVLADPPLVAAFAAHQLSFVSRPSEAAYDTCNPPAGGYPSPCGNVPASSCYQYLACQTVYDTCVGYSYDYCCGELPLQASPDESFFADDCRRNICGGPYEYYYACNPHPGNCITRQQIQYDLSSCTCTNVLLNRNCSLTPKTCNPGACLHACSEMLTGNNVGPQGCCVDYENQYFSCVGPTDPYQIDMQYQLP